MLYPKKTFSGYMYSEKRNHHGAGLKHFLQSVPPSPIKERYRVNYQHELVSFDGYVVMTNDVVSSQYCVQPFRPCSSLSSFRIRLIPVLLAWEVQ